MTDARREELYRILEEVPPLSPTNRASIKARKTIGSARDEINAANAHARDADSTQNPTRRAYHQNRANTHMMRARVAGNDPQERCPNAYHRDPRTGKCVPAQKGVRGPLTHGGF